LGVLRQPWELPRQPWELPRQPWGLPRQPWELPSETALGAAETQNSDSLRNRKFLEIPNKPTAYRTPAAKLEHEESCSTDIVRERNLAVERQTRTSSAQCAEGAGDRTNIPYHKRMLRLRTPPLRTEKRKKKKKATAEPVCAPPIAMRGRGGSTPTPNRSPSPPPDELADHYMGHQADQGMNSSQSTRNLPVLPVILQKASQYRTRQSRTLDHLPIPPLKSKILSEEPVWSKDRVREEFLQKKRAKAAVKTARRQRGKKAREKKRQIQRIRS
jgi:hypothetical protein